MMQKFTCIFILSEKSSGSSMLFRSLGRYLGIHKYPSSRHFEQETLFWTKAASLLDLPQQNMAASEVPIPQNRARKDLESFLSQNIDEDFSHYSDEELVYEGWYKLIQAFGPIFIEKSPHHLMQVSALNLMCEFASRYPDVDVKFVGIVRNPYETACSQFRRWQIPISVIESQWRLAYTNLRKLAKRDPGCVYTLLYEDYLSSPETALKALSVFLHLDISDGLPKFEPVKVSKANKTRDKFGFKLSSRTIELAKSFGYQESQLNNPPSRLWPVYKLYMMYVLKNFKMLLKIAKPNLASNS